MASVVEAESDDGRRSNNGREVGLDRFSTETLMGVMVSAHSAGHFAAFEVASQAVDVVVLADNRISMIVEDRPLKLPGVVRASLDVMRLHLKVLGCEVVRERISDCVLRYGESNFISLN